MGRRLGYALKRAQHALRVEMDAALKPLGLTAPQYAVIAAIDLEAGISNAALARAAFVTPQTMQAILANLERDGLVARRPDPMHGRILRSALTDRGRAVLERSHDAVDQVEKRMLGQSGDRQVADLMDCLGRFADNLKRAEPSS